MHYTSAVRKAIAGSKFAFIEKYGFAYEEDIQLIKDSLDANVTYLDDGKRVRIEAEGRVAEAIVRQPEQKPAAPSGKGGWIEA
jgi:hypothetical protein